MKSISDNKFNILFVATLQSYFVDNQASFSRMYNNLIYFHKHKKFNVIVLQPDFDRDQEKDNLKLDIKTHYFKQIKFLKNTMGIFTDFNPLFIKKIIHIIKKYEIEIIHVEFPFGINCLRFITKIPISYNAHNVEYLYSQQIGKYYYKIPRFLRFLFIRYIYFIEKQAIKLIKNLNAISILDKKRFIEIYRVPKEKIFISNLGYKKEIYNNPLKREIARERLNIDKNKFIVIFHGSYFQSDANREAIHIIKEKIAPFINDDNILFLLAGERPPLRNRRNLRFLGFIEDLRDLLYAADIAIVPIFRGSGVRTKIVDYLSANIPLITTKKGIEGLKFENNIHGYIVNNSPKEIIEKILFLKHNLNKINEFKKNIRELILNNYKWEIILNKLVLRYKEIIKAFKEN